MKPNNVVVGVIGGLALGAILGVLFAPHKGSKTRQKIADKGHDPKDSIESGMHSMADSVHNKYNEIASKIEGKLDEVKSSKL